MRKVVSAVICVAMLVAAPSAAAGPGPNVAALTRVASRLSGLPAKTRVRVVLLDKKGMRHQALRLLDRDYAADERAYDETVYRALGLLGSTESLRPALVRTASASAGLYDPLSRRVFARSGRRQNGTIVHELVHALQDQRFNLRRISSLHRDRDGALAAAAAVQGHATFATRVLGRLVVAGDELEKTGSPLADFLALESRFPDTTAVRFMTTLHNVGGNSAIFTALRSFPTTTKQIFHVDAFLGREAAARIDLPSLAAGYTLGRRDTFGELDVRALLAVFSVPRLDRAGEGWSGGRTALYETGAGRRAVVVRLDWDEDLDASQWAEAVDTYVNEAFDADRPGLPATSTCAADRCWEVAGRAIAFVRRGWRTSFVVGESVQEAAELAVATAG